MLARSGECCRRLAVSCRNIHTTPIRPFFTSNINRAEASSVPSPAVNAGPTTRPVGGIRGGIFGFLLGFSVASAFASYKLLEEYKLASDTLQASIEELQASTQKVSTHIRRIEAVEKELKALTESAAGREDIARVRSEMKKLYDGLHIEFLDLRSYVWGIQQDVHALAKKEATSVSPPS